MDIDTDIDADTDMDIDIDIDIGREERASQREDAVIDLNADKRPPVETVVDASFPRTEDTRWRAFSERDLPVGVTAPPKVVVLSPAQRRGAMDIEQDVVLDTSASVAPVPASIPLYDAVNDTPSEAFVDQFPSFRGQWLSAPFDGVPFPGTEHYFYDGPSPAGVETVKTRDVGATQNTPIPTLLKTFSTGTILVWSVLCVPLRPMPTSSLAGRRQDPSGTLLARRPVKTTSVSVACPEIEQRVSTVLITHNDYDSYEREYETAVATEQLLDLESTERQYLFCNRVLFQKLRAMDSIALSREQEVLFMRDAAHLVSVGDPHVLLRNESPTLLTAMLSTILVVTEDTETHEILVSFNPVVPCQAMTRIPDGVPAEMAPVFSTQDEVVALCLGADESGLDEPEQKVSKTAVIRCRVLVSRRSFCVVIPRDEEMYPSDRIPTIDEEHERTTLARQIDRDISRLPEDMMVGVAQHKYLSAFLARRRDGVFQSVRNGVLHSKASTVQKRLIPSVSVVSITLQEDARPFVARRIPVPLEQNEACVYIDVPVSGLFAQCFSPELVGSERYTMGAATQMSVLNVHASYEQSVSFSVVENADKEYAEVTAIEDVLRQQGQGLGQQVGQQGLGQSTSIPRGVYVGERPSYMFQRNPRYAQQRGAFDASFFSADRFFTNPFREHAFGDTPTDPRDLLRTARGQDGWEEIPFPEREPRELEEQ